MRYGTIVIFIFSILSAMCPAKAQKQIFTTYDVSEGLVHNSIRNIFQDSKGFIWIATWEGLSKYDGHKFTNYTTVNGLSHGLINDIYESKEGNIYIVCNDGSVDIIKNNLEPRKLLQTNIVINRLQALSNDKIIAGTDHNGLYEFTEGKLFKPRQPYPLKNYYHLTQLNDSLFIVQGDSSMEILNYRYELFCEWSEQLSLFAECGLLTDSKKRVWIGTRKGLKLLSPLQEKGQGFHCLDLPGSFNLPILRDGWIRYIFEDDAGNLWFGTYGGLVKIGPDGSQQVITEKDGLPTSDVTCISQDREGNIWVGGSQGVGKLVTKTNISIYTVEKGLLSNNISCLLPLNSGNIIVGSHNGLQLYDKAKGRFSSISKDKNYSSDNDQNSSLALMAAKNTVFPFTVFFRKKSDPVFFSPSSLGSYFAIKDQKGFFFYPTTSGIWFSRDFVNSQKALFFTDTRSLLIDSKGSLWAGSFDSGLYRIRYEYINDTPRLVRQDHFFHRKGIRSLYEDSKGYVWIGTRYHGIFRMKPDATDESDMLHFEQSTGLTSNRITSIGEDKDGCIWVDFYNGLDKLIPEENTYRVFNFSRCNNFFTNIQGMVFDKDHSMWLATIDGMVNIRDGKMENLAPLVVHITAASLGDSIYRNYGEKKIILGYRDKQVQFEFAAPGFINEKQVLFSYRLLGSNNTDWSKATNEHSVSYANLQPGNYRFEVRNKGWNDEWGNATGFEFVILPPFWQTWWFILLVSLFAAFLIYILVKRRIGQVRKEGELKQKITETEMRALRAQMNPHFIFNCLNSIDNLIQNNEKEKATTYLAKFAKLIRAILENSKSNAIPCWKDMETLKLYLELEELRCDKRFSYKVIIDEEILHGDYKVPPLVIQPFVENAIHHGLMNKKEGNKELQISVCAENNEIRYVIEDNGVGRKQAEEYKKLNRSFHNSMGMDITKERINLLNGQNGSVNITDLYDEQQQSKGTKVEVRLINKN